MTIRRGLLAFTALVLTSVAGCGMMIQAMEGEPVWLRHRASQDVPGPSHRAVLATLDVLKAELSGVEIVDYHLSQDDRFDTPEGKTPGPGRVEIPGDYPAFLVDGLNEDQPVIVNCRFCCIQGKMKDGRKVDAVIRIDLDGPKPGTVVSVQVGRRGDPEASDVLLDKIADRSAHPTRKPGSPEERAALNEAFGPRPETEEKTNEPKSEGLKIRKEWRWRSPAP